MKEVTREDCETCGYYYCEEKDYPTCHCDDDEAHAPCNEDMFFGEE